MLTLADFANTALASFAGSALTGAIAWLIYIGQRRGQKDATDSDAVSRAFEASAQHCRDLWKHQAAVARIKVIASGNAWTINGDFSPPVPSSAPAVIIARAELVRIKKSPRRDQVRELIAALENSTGDWLERVKRIEKVSLSLVVPNK